MINTVLKRETHIRKNKINTLVRKHILLAPRSEMLTLSEIVYHTARCSRCDQIKTQDEFAPDKRNRTGLQSSCRQCENKRCREYNLSDHGQERCREWSQSDHGRAIRKRAIKKYKQSDHGRKRRKQSDAERYNTDPKFKMTQILRRRLTGALQQAKHGKAVKCAHTLDILGCEMDFFMQYIEQQFQPGMTWQNHGQWHIDHIKPCASFDLTDPEQQKTCFNFSNMQFLPRTTYSHRRLTCHVQFIA